MEEDTGVKDDLLTDIATLRAIIDAALEEGIRSDDILIRACTTVLGERKTRLEQLEREP